MKNPYSLFKEHSLLPQLLLALAEAEKETLESQENDKALNHIREYELSANSRQ